MIGRLPVDGKPHLTGQEIRVLMTLQTDRRRGRATPVGELASVLRPLLPFSKATVRQYVTRVRRKGYDIEAVPSFGYRLRAA